MKHALPWTGAFFLLCYASSLPAEEKPTPSAPQPAQAKLQEEFLNWKFGMFLHFNLGTFVGREWAIGYEDPALFNPRELDCGQWADAAKAAGMKYAVLTVKHTEGYPLWDSQYTSHDISAFKNYRGGQGDIVREYVDAFRKRGLKVGFYYCFPGNYSASGTNSLVPPGKPDLQGLPPEAQGDYVGFMKKQLTELLSNYGPIDLLWIDQYSNPYTWPKWQEIKAHIKSLQPNCVLLANNSLDFKDTDIHSYEYPYQKISNPARALPKEGNQAAAEVCDCITSNGTWFWHPGAEKHLRSAEEVVTLLRKCNARRANYLLDVPPDRTGRIPEAFVTRLQEIGKLFNTPTPLLSILDRFTAPDVPKVGPEELPSDPPRWIVSTKETDPSFPGGGLSRHPMLYIGEGCNTMFLVNYGKVIWTYSTGKGWEYDDIWMLSNGNILFSRMSWAGEVTPQKKLVWRLDAPQGTEIHTVQPLGLDRVLLMQNGKPPKLMIVNKKTGSIEVEHAMPDDEKGVHAQFRRLRMTAQGTYLVPFLQMHRVVEYDQNFKEIWSYAIKTPWAAIRLHNGNTLITDEGDKLTREVNPKGETVWEIKLSELPPEYRLADSQSCIRLAIGNTILCSRGDGGKRPQLVEVTPDKKVVWVLNDWKNLGPATAIQVLADPGIPENPGGLQR